MLAGIPAKVQSSRSVLLGLALLLFLNAMLAWLPRALRFVLPDPNAPVAQYIESHTSPTSYVLMWSAEIGYNFLTERPTPSRYIHQYPLFTQGYQRPAMVKELIDQLAEKKPLIIDCSAGDPLSPPIDDSARRNWKPYVSSWRLMAEMNDLFAFIHSHYQLVGVTGPGKWPVYSYTD